jgi:hypothetical protein
VIRLYQWTPENTHIVVKINKSYIRHTLLFISQCVHVPDHKDAIGSRIIKTAAPVYCKQTLCRSIWMSKLCTIRNNFGTIKRTFLVWLFVTYLLSYRRCESYYSLWRRFIVNMAMNLWISWQEIKPGSLNTRPTIGFYRQTLHVQLVA